MQRRRHENVQLLRSEWDRVRAGMEPGSSAQMKHDAVGILHVWKQRGDGRAHGVIIDLTEVVLRAEHQYQRAMADSSDDAWMMRDDARDINALAVIRFINYASKIGEASIGGGYGNRRAQQKRFISDKVAAIDVPEWLVLLRHACSHRDMPPNEQLTHGVTFCRNWLWSNYWAAHYDMAVDPLQLVDDEDVVLIDGDDGGAAAPADFDCIVDVLKQFKQRNVYTAPLPDSLMERLQQLLTRHNIELFLSVLLSDYGLMMKAEDALQMEWKTSNDSTRLPSLPPKCAQLFWKPVLHAIVCRPNGPADLLVSLVRRLRSVHCGAKPLPQPQPQPAMDGSVLCLDDEVASPPADEHRGPGDAAQLHAWIRMMLESLVKGDTLTSGQWAAVANEMLLHADIFHHTMISLVLDKVTHVEPNAMAGLRSLADTYTGSEEVVERDGQPSPAVSVGAGNAQRLHTVDDLLQMGASSRIKCTDKSATAAAAVERTGMSGARQPSTGARAGDGAGGRSFGVWRQCGGDPAGWARTPLGLAPGQNADNLDLMLAFDTDHSGYGNGASTSSGRVRQTSAVASTVKSTVEPVPVLQYSRKRPFALAFANR